MNRIKWGILFSLFTIPLASAQDANNKSFLKEGVSSPFDITESFAIEKQINPDKYIIGPGDKLGLSILGNENLTFLLTVTPTGDLFIPSVGIVSVSGLTLSESLVKVEEFTKENAYPKASVSMALMNIREFKVKVLGAVNKPGFVIVSSDSRLSEAITKAGGLHRYSDETKITITRFNKKTEGVSFKYLQHNNSENQNPKIMQGDVINVLFNSFIKEDLDEFVTSKANSVFITGFVRAPGSQRFNLGFSLLDYIGMAGGVHENGSIKNVTVYRQGKLFNPDLTAYIQPGDQIHVHANIKYRFFGNTSVLQTVTAIMSLYLTYQAATQ